MSGIRENDVRPFDLKQGQVKAQMHDIEFLKTRKSEFIDVKCPACGESHGVKHWEKHSFNFEKCRNCSTVYMNPRPPESVLHQFYDQSENYAYWNKYIFPASEDARRERIFKPRADRLEEILKRLNVKRKAMLEIGAGFGTFAAEIQSRKLFDRVVALEMTPSLAETCRKRGLEVLECPIEACDIQSAGFDVIVSYETLEHIFNPQGFLASVKKLLCAGGMLILSCPNGEGFDVLTLGTKSDTVDHEHLNYFNPHSIKVLLERADFTIKEVATPGQLDADIVHNKAISGEIDLSTSPFLRHILVDRWESCGANFQSYLQHENLSSHMLVVAQNS